MVSQTPPSGSPRHSLSRLSAWVRGWAWYSSDEDIRNLAAFWLLGLLNNSVYVVMLAGANEISKGAVGLVYFCGIFPTIVIKATGPYWFHLFSYQTRLWAVALLMCLSYTTVALGKSLSVQLLGVAIGSAQSGMGEATCLGLSAFFNSRKTITFWSSGTGAAGLFGYSWVTLLHTFGGLSLPATLLLANSTCAAWLASFYFLLQPPATLKPRDTPGAQGAESGALSPDAASPDAEADEAPGTGLLTGSESRHDAPHVSSGGADQSTRMGSMSGTERWQRTLSLWPYMVPLFTVFFAEYTLQAGTWSAIGFPVHSQRARDRFYKLAGLLYQVGVFLSRSSGVLYQASRLVLWLMPGVQVVLLLLFSLDAWWHFWYNETLYIACFVVGLLGGAVYVNAFTLIGKETDPEYTEFSLTAASVADSFGISLADLGGILLQGCIYRANNLEGAVFAC